MRMHIKVRWNYANSYDLSFSSSHLKILFNLTPATFEVTYRPRKKDKIPVANHHNFSLYKYAASLSYLPKRKAPRMNKISTETPVRIPSTMERKVSFPDFSGGVILGACFIRSVVQVSVKIPAQFTLRTYDACYMFLHKD